MIEVITFICPETGIFWKSGRLKATKSILRKMWNNAWSFWFPIYCSSPTNFGCQYKISPDLFLCCLSTRYIYIMILFGDFFYFCLFFFFLRNIFNLCGPWRFKFASSKTYESKELHFCMWWWMDYEWSKCGLQAPWLWIVSLGNLSLDNCKGSEKVAMLT